MENYTHVIWDFNGTLYNDVDVCLTCANRLLSAHGLKKLFGIEEYRALFGFPIIDYYRRMGFDFDKTPYSELAVEWVAYYLDESHNAFLFPDTQRVLSAVHALGIKQLILSATELTMLERQVSSLGIRPYFDGLLGLSDIHAHSKEEIGKRWRASHPDAKLLMIGDTDHDAAVAEAMGADCILVAAGHQSRKTLQACHPLCVVNSISQVLKQF